MRFDIVERAQETYALPVTHVVVDTAAVPA